MNSDSISAKKLIQLLSLVTNNKNSISPRQLVLTSNKCGKYRVLEYCGKNKYGHQVFKIKFLQTGFICTSNIGLMNKGDVKDYMLPTVCNVAYIGKDCKELRKLDPILYEALNKRWHAMIRRCYSEKDFEYNNYGGKGITVCERWLNFSNYFKDVQKLEGYNRELLLKRKISIDKDKLQQNIPKNKTIYSPDKCIWLSNKEQIKYTNCH